MAHDGRSSRALHPFRVPTEAERGCGPGCRAATLSARSEQPAATLKDPLVPSSSAKAQPALVLVDEHLLLVVKERGLSSSNYSGRPSATKWPARRGGSGLSAARSSAMRSMDRMLLHRAQAVRKLLIRAQGAGREWPRGMRRAAKLHGGPASRTAHRLRTGASCGCGPSFSWSNGSLLH